MLSHPVFGQEEEKLSTMDFVMPYLLKVIIMFVITGSMLVIVVRLQPNDLTANRYPVQDYWKVESNERIAPVRFECEVEELSHNVVVDMVDTTGAPDSIPYLQRTVDDGAVGYTLVLSPQEAIEAGLSLEKSNNEPPS